MNADEENVVEIEPEVVQEPIQSNVEDDNDMEFDLDEEDKPEAEEESEGEPDPEDDGDYLQPGASSRKAKGLRNRFDYPELTGIFSRYSDVSLEAAFKMLNAYVSDMIKNLKVVFDVDKEFFPELIEFLESQRFSRTKLENMIKRLVEKTLNQHSESGPFFALGIDGKEGLVGLKNNKYIPR